MYIDDHILRQCDFLFVDINKDGGMVQVRLLTDFGARARIKVISGEVDGEIFTVGPLAEAVLNPTVLKELENGTVELGDASKIYLRKQDDVVTLWTS